MVILVSVLIYGLIGAYAGSRAYRWVKHYQKFPAIGDEVLVMVLTVLLWPIMFFIVLAYRWGQEKDYRDR